MILDRAWDDFLGKLRGQGQSIEQYCRTYQTNEKSVRNLHDWEIAWAKFIKSRITQQNLEKFYRLHPERYADAKWKVSHLFIPIEKGVADSAEIASHRIKTIHQELSRSLDSQSELEQAFADLARKESDGATAQNGGLLGWVTNDGDLPPQLLRAIQNASPGSVTAPVKSPLGFHLALIHQRETIDVPFDQLKDTSRLRRDAASALFASLEGPPQDSKVRWYISQLKPAGSASTDSKSLTDQQ